MDLATLRDDLVEGLEHPSKGVLESDAIGLAMRSVPRHEFVESPSPESAYEDRAFERLGTTVLAPSTVALLLEALDPGDDDDVLVVGVGVGYTAALLAEMVGPDRVAAIDLSRQLVWDARRNLAETGYEAVLVDRRNGSDGLPEYAPFDRILVEAAGIDAPRPLVEQLGEGGRLVMPMGAKPQELVAIDPDGDVVGEFGSVRFKPLLVEGEEAGGIERNRTARETREFAARAAETRGGWEQEWIDWDDP